MAQITITFQDATGSGTTNVTLSNADMDRMVSTHRQMFADVDGKPATKQQALREMARTAFTIWKENTRSFERSAAVKAVPMSADIPITEV